MKIVGIKPVREGRKTIAFDVVVRTVDVLNRDGVTLHIESIGSRETVASVDVAGSVKRAQTEAMDRAREFASVRGFEFGGLL